MSLEQEFRQLEKAFQKQSRQMAELMERLARIEAANAPLPDKAEDPAAILRAKMKAREVVTALERGDKVGRIKLS